MAITSRPELRAIKDPAPLLELDGVTLQYREDGRVVTAVDRVSLDVYRSDRFVLLGPSGCGKSSLLKAVGGFLAPSHGRITLAGKPIAEPGPDRMMVFQDFEQLLPWKNVLANVMFPMVRSGRFDRKSAKERAEAIIDRVGLGNFRDAFPHTLSGGMKQRVAIARALAAEPAILLMDEPFAALDALTRRQMQEELLALWDETQFTLLFVTHSIDEAIVVGTRILVMSPHPGRVRAELDAAGLGHRDRSSLAFASFEARLHGLVTEQKENAYEHQFHHTA